MVLGNQLYRTVSSGATKYRPAFEGAKFDKSGYCLKHPMIQLCKPVQQKVKVITNNRCSGVDSDTSSEEDANSITKFCIVRKTCYLCGEHGRRNDRKLSKQSWAHGYEAPQMPARISYQDKLTCNDSSMAAKAKERLGRKSSASKNTSLVKTPVSESSGIKSRGRLLTRRSSDIGLPRDTSVSSRTTKEMSLSGGNGQSFRRTRSESIRRKGSALDVNGALVEHDKKAQKEAPTATAIVPYQHQISCKVETIQPDLADCSAVKKGQDSTTRSKREGKLSEKPQKEEIRGRNLLLRSQVRSERRIRSVSASSRNKSKLDQQIDSYFERRSSDVSSSNRSKLEKRIESRRDKRESDVGSSNKSKLDKRIKSHSDRRGSDGTSSGSSSKRSSDLLRRQSLSRGNSSSSNMDLRTKLDVNAYDDKGHSTTMRYEVPFNTVTGRCMKHPTVKLAKKNPKGGWEIIQMECPKCNW